LLLYLQEHECLIDFIAVSPDARGKGVGGKLMAWAEATGAAILAETETEAVVANGIDMTLWVSREFAWAACSAANLPALHKWAAVIRLLACMSALRQ
jgi:GNAT superfamily N-acetyltransferase